MSTWTVYDAFDVVVEQGSNAAANAHDGDTSPYYTLYNPYLSSPGSPYIIEEDFGQTVTVTQFKVFPTNVDEYNWVRVEYWTGSAWALVGDATTTNAWNTFNGSWTTSKWRVLWVGHIDFGYSVNVNEMQAVVGTTTIDVSDSGTGTESTIKFVDGAIEVSDSGTGTESATKITFGSTWTVYSGIGDVLEQGSNAAASAHDGDTSTYYTLFPPEYDFPFIIEEDFGQTLTITQFKVYATYVDASNLIMVEYWTGSAWALVGYVTTANTWTTFSGSWTTSKWRVSHYFDYFAGGAILNPVQIGEMQAVSQSLTLITASDSGTGTETASTLFTVVASDSGSGTETASTLFIVVASDSGSGTDQLTNKNLLGLTDTGSGGEVAVPSTSIVTTDSGTGTETANAILLFFVTDSGWGNEAPTLIATFNLTDTGGGAEGVLMNTEVFDASSLSGEEIARVLGQVDGGTSTEALPLRLVGVLDNGTGQESSPTLIVFTRDNGVGGELAIVTNLLSMGDEGVGQEKPLRVIHAGAFVFLRPD